MNFSQCITYLFGTVKELNNMVVGKSFYKETNIKSSLNVLKLSSKKLDLSNSVSYIYDALGAYFWFGLFILLLYSAVGTLTSARGIFGLIGGVFSIASLLFIYILKLIVAASFIQISESCNRRWKTYIAQLITIGLYMVAIFSVLSILSSAVHIVTHLFSFSMTYLLYTLVSVVKAYFIINCAGIILMAISQGVPYDADVETTDNFATANPYNQNSHGTQSNTYDTENTINAQNTVRGNGQS